ncbi:MAG TPA: hypothetical protein VFQ35_16940, partial [Polyangiaceae bacterium]|nr:hypothetical protein [Polyangiaceae bacterium]
MQGSPTLGRGDIAKTFGIVLGIAAFAFCKAAGAVPNERATGERANRDAPGDVLRVAFSDCEAEPLGKQAFLKVLSLELGRRQLRESSSEAAALSVVYRCDGSAHVRVASTSPEVDRELRVDDVAPRERARALALAV